MTSTLLYITSVISLLKYLWSIDHHIYLDLNVQSWDIINYKLRNFFVRLLAEDKVPNKEEKVEIWMWFTFCQRLSYGFS